jgi:hypothetical protein
MVDLFALCGSGRRGTSCRVMQIIADTHKNSWSSFAVFQVKPDGKRTVRKRVEQQKCKLDRPTSLIAMSRARVTPEGLLGLREIEKDFPALVEVLKRFLDFVNRIDRGHRNGQRAGGDEGRRLDLRGEHLGDMVVVA